MSIYKLIIYIMNSGLPLCHLLFFTKDVSTLLHLYPSIIFQMIQGHFNFHITVTLSILRQFLFLKLLLQYFMYIYLFFVNLLCWEAWHATGHGVAESNTTVTEQQQQTLLKSMKMLNHLYIPHNTLLAFVFVSVCMRAQLLSHV